VCLNRCLSAAAIVALLWLSAPVGLLAAEAQEPTPFDYCLELEPPAGWAILQSKQVPHRFGGTFLAGWSKATPAGTAIIYVLGLRDRGQYLSEQLASAFAEFLEGARVPYTADSGFCIMGRPAHKFVMTGKGTGQMIAGLCEGCSGTTPTYVETVFVTHLWPDGSGTDFIQFVFAAPEKGRAALRPDFKSLLMSARLTEAAAPPARNQPAPAGPGGNSGESGTGHGGAGAIVALVDGPLGDAKPTLRFVAAVAVGTSAKWVVPKDDRVQTYVCTWSQRRAAWVLPCSRFRELATLEGDTYVLVYSEALRPYFGRWDYLWTPPAK